MCTEHNHHCGKSALNCYNNNLPFYMMFYNIQVSYTDANSCTMYHKLCMQKKTYSTCKFELLQSA